MSSTDRIIEIEKIMASIKRWKSRLKRAMTAIEKLDRKLRRLEAKPVAPKVDLKVKQPEPMHHDAFVPRGDLAATADVGDMPDFLKRGMAADKAAADQIRAEQEALKKAKGKGRIEKMKAKARGDLKKMPLTGKAALAAIHGDKNQT